MSDPLAVLAERPAARTPRDYHFPAFTRERLANGLTMIAAHLPGRPLLAAQLLMGGGAATEPAAQGGVTALAAHALTEGTRRRSAIDFIEAAERLGAELHAEAGWDGYHASLEVPRSRFAAALALLAEMVLEPAFPDDELARLRAERMNDLLQARAEPRRRVERAFLEAIYAPDAAFRRPLGGSEDTVPALDREAVAARHAELLDPGRAQLIVAGDLLGLPLHAMVEEHFGAWPPGSADPPGAGERAPAAAPDRPRDARAEVVLIDRPGSPQTEVRIGHVGLPRQIPDFHALSVMSSILGGLFNSRLNRLLREERGYTYGVGASFDLRRAAGPFSVRTAVETDVTGPAVADILGELRRIREAPVEEEELREARDFLVGVFPLRFESPPQVVAAIASLVLHGLPDDELDRYRPAVASVTADEVQRAAQHVRPDDAWIVLVGSAEAVTPGLREAGIAEPRVERDALLDGLTAAVGASAA